MNVSTPQHMRGASGRGGGPDFEGKGKVAYGVRVVQDGGELLRDPERR